MRKGDGITKQAVSLAICCSLVLGNAASAAQPSKLIYRSAHYSVFSDRVVEGSYTAEALSSTQMVSNYPVSAERSESKRQWTLQDNVAEYPQFHSGAPLLDAIYNLSLGEFKRDISKVNEFDAGALWPGVWTRDVSYSIVLSLAMLDPKRAEATLLRKVNRDRIIQDTGTGGSWPVSTDRVCWTVAAWEIYLVTGDKQWLEKSSKIIENTIHDDEAVVIDPVSGLAHGESSFMDWREQTYPLWMEPVDIYESENLGTNALYYRTYRVLAAMDEELGRPARDWGAKAERIRTAMNERMWMKDKGLYGQYLYGRVWQTLSPRSDALGEALCVLFDIPAAASQDAILWSQPLMPFGVPTVYPETPKIEPYHNRSVWPFVQAYWNLAAAKRGNESALLYGLASMCRSTALFLTNKENFVADTGSPIGTAVNSDRQLWSVAGSLAMVYRVLFGMEFATDGLHLHPVIPEALAGTRSLTNFHYRQAVLSLTVKGHGNRVRRITLDGKPAKTTIAPTLSGPHTIVMELEERRPHSRPLNFVETLTALDTPTPKLDGHTLTWAAIEGARGYQVYRNGAFLTEISKNSFTPATGTGLTQYQIAALGDTPRSTSFLSAPVLTSEDAVAVSVANPKAVHSESFVTLEQTGVTGLSLDGISKSGKYSISVRFANGSGPINTSNMCAVRTLFIDGKQIGPIVMPQRGVDKWTNWGFSNSQEVELTGGTHKIELRLLPEDLNMNGKVNKVMIISVLLAPLSINPPAAVPTTY